MSLGNIYSSQVKSTPIPIFSGSSTMQMPSIERDPTINNLERELFKKFQEISPPEEIVYNKKTVSSVSVEDAIKELLELEKSFK
jgi:hypothetical protein